MNSKPVRILLADDHDVVRAGIRTMLESRKGWRVCAEASNGAECVRLVRENKFDVAVLDLEMPDMDGATAAREIKQQQPEMEVVIFTAHDDEHLIRKVLDAGVRAVVVKSDGGRTLVKAIENVLQRKPFITMAVSETVVKTFLKSRGQESSRLLTDREREIVQLLADGHSNKEVAKSLGISVKTVETHRARIMRKIGVNSIVELVRYAVRERLINA
jgi:DNA-binding NarL/FixJ family response regulator